MVTSRVQSSISLRQELDKCVAIDHVVILGGGSDAITVSMEKITVCVHLL
jgi:hypothetical protein